MTTKAKSLTSKRLCTILAEAPFFPKGLTVSIQCNVAEVTQAIQELAALSLELSVGEAATVELLDEEEKNHTVTLPDIPEGIIEYAESWGEEWVKSDVLERAKRLYLEHGDWETVYQELLKQDGESK